MSRLNRTLSGRAKRPPIAWRANLEWVLSGLLVLRVRVGDRMLATTLTQEGGWSVVCVESRADVKSIADVLGDHSHEVLGPFAEPEPALKAMRDYTTRWAEAKSEGAASAFPCDCETIKLPAKKGRRK